MVDREFVRAGEPFRVVRGVLRAAPTSANDGGLRRGGLRGLLQEIACRLPEWN